MNNEKLEKITTEHKIFKQVYPEHRFWHEQNDWLLARVKKLTEALESLKIGAKSCISDSEDEEDIPMDASQVLIEIEEALEDK